MATGRQCPVDATVGQLQEWTKRCQTSIGVSMTLGGPVQPPGLEWQEARLAIATGIPILVLVTYVVYRLAVTKAVLSHPWRTRAVLATLAVGNFSLGFWLLPRATSTPVSHYISTFVVGAGGMSAFKMLDVALDTVPPGCCTGFRGFLAYFFMPSEPELAADGKKPRRVTARAALGQLLHLLYTIFVLGVLLDFGYASRYQPFDVALLNEGYVGILVLTMVEHGFSIGSLMTMALGYQPKPAMVQPCPLLRSASLRDFWGRRYNLAISRMLRRSWMDPLLGARGDKGLSDAQQASRRARNRVLGPFLVFSASGLLHEALHPFCLKIAFPGLVTAFFLLQFVLCTLETEVGRRLGPVQRRVVGAGGVLGTVLFEVLGRAWTYGALLVTAWWFVHPYMEVDFFVIYAHVYPRFRVSVGGSCDSLASAGTC